MIKGLDQRVDAVPVLKALTPCFEEGSDTKVDYEQVLTAVSFTLACSFSLP